MNCNGWVLLFAVLTIAGCREEPFVLSGPERLAFGVQYEGEECIHIVLHAPGIERRCYDWGFEGETIALDPDGNCWSLPGFACGALPNGWSQPTDGPCSSSTDAIHHLPECCDG